MKKEHIIFTKQKPSTAFLKKADMIKMLLNLRLYFPRVTKGCILAPLVSWF